MIFAACFFLICLLGFVTLAFGFRALRWTLIALCASPFILVAAIVFMSMTHGPEYPYPVPVQPTSCTPASPSDPYYGIASADSCDPPSERASPPPSDPHAQALQQLLGEQQTPLN